MNFIKEHRRLTAIIAAAVLLVLLSMSYIWRTSLTAAESGPLYGNSELAPVEERAFVESASAPAGMKLAASSNKLELYINQDTAEFAVLDKDNDKIWYSNPPMADEDALAVGDMKNRLKSQLFVEYYNSKYQSKTMNSYFFSVKEENFEILPIASGFRTVYTIGKKDFTKDMLPQVLDKERFEALISGTLEGDALKLISRRYKLRVISQLDEFKREEYQSAYPALDVNKEYYILDMYTPEYEYEDIYKIVFEQSAYTMEDWSKDNEANGIVAEQIELELLTIPLEVTLDNNGLVVNIPFSEVVAPDNVFIKKLHVLEYFGAGSIEDNGYMLLPDGSGSIVNFNNNKHDAPPFEVTIYGEDKSIKKDDATVRYPKAAVPVFAEKNGEAGFLAIIKEGDAHAVVRAEVAGLNTSYNHIYTSYNVLPVDFMVTVSNQNPIITNKYQEEMYQGNIRISYRFTGKHNSEYSDFAHLYRDHLVESEILKKPEGMETPFIVELLGRVEAEKNVLGVPYTSYEVLTSFAEGREIIEELKANGVESPVIKYSSWFDGNSQQTMTGFSGFAPGMGGKQDLAKLVESLAGGSDALYLNTSLMNVHRSLLDFNYVLYGTRHTYNEVAGIRPFNIGSGMPDRKQSKFYLLSPRYVGSHLSEISSKLTKLGSSSLWLDDMGSNLNSDFSKGYNVDRQEGLRLIQSALSQVSDLSIGFDSPNEYVFPYVSQAVNIPLTSSGHRLEDETVPFLPIILSGYMEYTGPVINLSGKAQDDMLKAVETGSGLHFKWIYADNTVIRSLDGPEPQKIYSLNYKEWTVQAGEFYNKMLADMEGLSGEPIVGHEKLADNVYRTTWKNGSVIVNYNDKVVTIKGKTIGAKNYLVERGER